MSSSPGTAQLEADLGPAVAARLTPRFHEVAVSAGDALMTHGVASDHLYLLCTGMLTASRGAGQTALVLGTVQPGAWLGEIGFIDGGPATATLTADVPCTLLAIDHASLVDLIGSDPEAAGALLRRVTRELASRLRRTSSGSLDAMDEGGFHLEEEAQHGWVSKALSWLAGGKEA